jgi:hypothetical protein
LHLLGFHCLLSGEKTETFYVAAPLTDCYKEENCDPVLEARGHEIYRRIMIHMTITL